MISGQYVNQEDIYLGEMPSMQDAQGIATASSRGQDTIAHHVQTDILLDFAGTHVGFHPTHAAPAIQDPGSDLVIGLGRLHPPLLSPLRPDGASSDQAYGIAGVGSAPTTLYPQNLLLHLEPGHSIQPADSVQPVGAHELANLSRGSADNAQ